MWTGPACHEMIENFLCFCQLFLSHAQEYNPDDNRFYSEKIWTQLLKTEGK
jgi:hypothetical protein